jgi:hypothetical protein
MSNEDRFRSRTNRSLTTKHTYPTSRSLLMWCYAISQLVACYKKAHGNGLYNILCFCVITSTFCWTLPSLVRSGAELLDRRVPAPRLVDIIVTNFVRAASNWWFTGDSCSSYHQKAWRCSIQTKAAFEICFGYSNLLLSFITPKFYIKMYNKCSYMFRFW